MGVGLCHSVTFDETCDGEFISLPSEVRETKLFFCEQADRYRDFLSMADIPLDWATSCP